MIKRDKQSKFDNFILSQISRYSIDTTNEISSDNVSTNISRTKDNVTYYLTTSTYLSH